MRRGQSTRGPIRSARELSLTEAVASDTRRPPTSRRDHAGSTPARLMRLCQFLLALRGPPPSAVSGRVTRELSDILQEKRALRARMQGLARRPRRARSKAQRGRGGRRSTGLGFLPSRRHRQRSFPALRRCPTSCASGRCCGGCTATAVRLALPVMQGKGKPLVFRAWTPGDAMDSGVWGIAEPKADKPALEPDILLVPLLAFDRRGLAARLRRRLLRPHAAAGCARARPSSPSASATTSSRSTRCRISTMTSGSTGC